MSVLLICVHFSDDDGEALDHFFNDLREVLKQHAEAIHRPKKNKQIERAGVIVIPTSYACDTLETVVDRYFKQEKPFGSKGKE